MANDKEILKFIRVRDYKLERFLDKGKGATGETALLKDELLDMLFVCKKYHVDDPFREREYYRRFVDEVRLLFGAFHPNVVRVFGCYLFPTVFRGFIIMEYVDGTDLKAYLEGNPSQINRTFTQTISAFQHLEEKNILHRDIRPSNIMVSNDGIVKVIDFGFGKQIDSSDGFGKSITLNWAATEPKEFEQSKYDFCTEVYFVGKLFQTVIGDLGITDFGYSGILKQMTEYDPKDRMKSFGDVTNAILTGSSSTDLFSEDNRIVYRAMADFLKDAISEITSPLSVHNEAEKILAGLIAVKDSSQLETEVQDTRALIRVFLASAYRYSPTTRISTTDLAKFVDLFQSQSAEGRRIILANIRSRLETVRLTKPDDDDIPF